VARSTYVYLALDEHSTPLGAFTVKHELVWWLSHEQHKAVCVLRMSDGPRNSPLEMRGADISYDAAIKPHLKVR